MLYKLGVYFEQYVLISCHQMKFKDSQVQSLKQTDHYDLKRGKIQLDVARRCSERQKQRVDVEEVVGCLVGSGLSGTSTTPSTTYIATR